MVASLIATLEWRANSMVQIPFDVEISVFESGNGCSAQGSLDPELLADPEAFEVWGLLCEASPNFTLVFDDGSDFEVALRQGDRAGAFSLTERDREFRP